MKGIGYFHSATNFILRFLNNSVMGKHDIELKNVFWLDETPQSQVSDEEIENMAKKEYPDDKCFIDRKVGFIRGFKAALQHNQQPNESNRKS
jgi:hypothetical protein